MQSCQENAVQKRLGIGRQGGSIQSSDVFYKPPLASSKLTVVAFSVSPPAANLEMLSCTPWL